MKEEGKGTLWPTGRVHLLHPTAVWGSPPAVRHGGSWSNFSASFSPHPSKHARSSCFNSSFTFRFIWLVSHPKHRASAEELLAQTGPQGQQWPRGQ